MFCGSKKKKNARCLWIKTQIRAIVDTEPGGIKNRIRQKSARLLTKIDGVMTYRNTVLEQKSLARIMK